MLQFSITELQNAFLSNGQINSQTKPRKLPKAPMNCDNHMFYHMDPGRTIGWFGGNFDFALDFISNISGETIGNFLMFLPFGILYPLSQKEPTWKKCVIRGLIAVAVIEVLQPIFGRAFDMNDVILNSLGIVVSTSIFMGVKKTIKR